jgi:predicted RNA-binding Zn-ribbon protein involved in translation (DUF1610 family)
MEAPVHWRNTALAALAVLAAALAVYRMIQVAGAESRRTADFPDGTLWVCLAPECGVEFSKTIAELAAFHRENPGAALPCPACGRAETGRALRCPNCSRGIARAEAGVRDATCPHCGQRIPPASQRLSGE